MAHQYIPAHTLRHVLQLCGMPEARTQIPVAVSKADPHTGGTIVMLERNTD
jgi:NAD(P)H-dependent FMN reductase